MIKTRGEREAEPLTPSPPPPTGTPPMTTPTACPLPSTLPTLSADQRRAIAQWIRELTAEGRHLEASTLAAEYFPLV